MESWIFVEHKGIMKNFSWLGLFVVLLWFGCVWAAELPVWEFPQAASQWTQLRRLAAVAEADCVRLEVLERDSGLGIEHIALEASQIGGFSVEYRAAEFAEGTSGQLYYATAVTPTFSQEL